MFKHKVKNLCKSYIKTILAVENGFIHHRLEIVRSEKKIISLSAPAREGGVCKDQVCGSGSESGF